MQDSEASEVYGIAVQKGNTKLLNDINEGLKKIKENGTFDQIFEEYINGNTNGASIKSDNFLSICSINLSMYLLIPKAMPF